MKSRHGKNTRIIPFLIIPFLLLGFIGDRALSADIQSTDAFQKQYREYEGHVRAGHAAINERDYTEAIDHYTRAIEMSPFVPAHYYYRGLAWFRKGNEAKAIEDFDKVVVLDSRWSSAYVYRSICRKKIRVRQIFYLITFFEREIL